MQRVDVFIAAEAIFAEELTLTTGGIPIKKRNNKFDNVTIFEGVRRR